MSKRGTKASQGDQEDQASQGKKRKAGGALTCSVHGTGIDVEIRVADDSSIARLARAMADALRDGIALVGHAGAGQPGAPRVDDPALRREVAGDLRKMWDAMWAGGHPLALTSDHEQRDLAWGSWIAGPVGQAIIDEVLSSTVGVADVASPDRPASGANGPGGPGGPGSGGEN